MLSILPQAVREARPRRDSQADSAPDWFQPAWRADRPCFWSGIDGYTDNPAAATSEMGRHMWELIVQDVANAFIDFYNSSY